MPIIAPRRPPALAIPPFVASEFRGGAAPTTPTMSAATPAAPPGTPALPAPGAEGGKYRGIALAALVAMGFVGVPVLRVFLDLC